MKRKPILRVMALLLCLMLASSQVLAVSSADKNVELTVLNPTGAVEVVGEYAPRLGDLNGKKVAFYLASKADDVAFDNVTYDKLAEKLKAYYPKVEIISYEDLPQDYGYASRDEVAADVLADEPDAVIIGVGG